MRQNGFISDLGLISAIIYIYIHTVYVCVVCVWVKLYICQTISNILQLDGLCGPHLPSGLISAIFRIAHDDIIYIYHKSLLDKTIGIRVLSPCDWSCPIDGCLRRPDWKIPFGIWIAGVFWKWSEIICII
jgi:hypothetical protein